MNIAIIVAAGSGTRFGGDRPKQFHEICGKPLLIHTLRRFEQCRQIDEVILVLAASEIENFKTSAAGFRLGKLSKIVSGGSTRARSVLNGLDAVTAEAKTVAVHDGARPLVTAEEIAAVVAKANEAGAACLVAPVTDTIKEVTDGVITGTIDRRRLRRALTPQVFRPEILRQAFAGAALDESVTDECLLVERIGYRVAAVEGSPKNIKITTREDLAAAEVWLREMETGQTQASNV